MDNPAYASVYIECRKCRSGTHKHMRSVVDALDWWNTRNGDYYEDYVKSEEQVRKQFANANIFMMKAEKDEAEIAKLKAERDELQGRYERVSHALRLYGSQSEEVFQLAHKRPVPPSIGSMLCNMTERHSCEMAKAFTQDEITRGAITDIALKKQESKEYWEAIHAEAESIIDRRVETLGSIECADDANHRKDMLDGWSAWLLAKRVVDNRRAAIAESEQG